MLCGFVTAVPGSKLLVWCSEGLLTFAATAHRVEWSFWTTASDGCGNSCDRQSIFKTTMQETAKQLEMVCSISQLFVVKSPQISHSS